MNNKKKWKAIALSLGLGAAMLAAPSVQAQGVFGDMLDNYYAEKEESGAGVSLLRGNYTINESTNGGFTNGGFGELEPEYPEAPLGSGIAILIGAGLGYVALKKKEDKQ